MTETGGSPRSGNHKLPRESLVGYTDRQPRWWEVRFVGFCFFRGGRGAEMSGSVGPRVGVARTGMSVAWCDQGPPSLGLHPGHVLSETKEWPILALGLGQVRANSWLPWGGESTSLVSSGHIVGRDGKSPEHTSSGSVKRTRHGSAGARMAARPRSPRGTGARAHVARRRRQGTWQVPLQGKASRETLVTFARDEWAWVGRACELKTQGVSAVT